MTEDGFGFDRRSLLRALGIGTVGVGLGGLPLLSACSSDDSASNGSDSAGSTTTTRSIPPYDRDKPYWVQGNFAPVAEESTVANLAVKGSIPPELSGLFVRNGSNPPSGKSSHWFVGDGMLHGIRIENGKASWYRNRYVTTPLHEAKKDILDFGGVPGHENTQANVALVHHGGKLLATGEVGWPYEIATDDLSTVGPWSFDGELGMSMTAHPKIDPETGRMHFFGYGFIEPGITYYVASPNGTVETTTHIEMDTAVMIHDFAITEKDVIFWIGPVVFGTDPNNPNPGIPFKWDPDGPCKVGVMPLGGTADQIRWKDLDPCFVFHGLNAWRDGEDIVLGVHLLPEAFGRRGDLLDPHLTEWRIGTAGDELTFASQRITDLSLDLPTHDKRHTGRRSRHGWCAITTPSPDVPSPQLGGICHIDTTTGREDSWDPGDSAGAGEGLFVPAGDGEGEGYVMTFVWHRATDLSSFAIFDAQEMKKGPIAEVELPVRVPFGFHGLWVDEEDFA